MERILGCLMGGAIGDAMGVPYEGMRSTVVSIEHEWRLSDDTQLTLATCEGILLAGGVFPSCIADRMLAWYQENRLTGMGASTQKALRDLSRGMHWATVGRKGEMAAGNGAAMRIAPLAFFLNPASYDDRAVIRDVCRITHHHDEAYAGALAVVMAIRAVISPFWSWEQSLTATVAATLPDTKVRDRLHTLSQLDPALPFMEVAGKYGTSGYVVESVPFALYAVQSVARLGFTDLLQEIISVGGDTDTNASIAGHITGAWLGHHCLPTDLLTRFPLYEMICDLGKQLAALAEV